MIVEAVFIALSVEKRKSVKMGWSCCLLKSSPVSLKIKEGKKIHKGIGKWSKDRQCMFWPWFFHFLFHWWRNISTARSPCNISTAHLWPSQLGPALGCVSGTFSCPSGHRLTAEWKTFILGWLRQTFSKLRANRGENGKGSNMKKVRDTEWKKGGSQNLSYIPGEIYSLDKAGRHGDRSLSQAWLGQDIQDQDNVGLTVSWWVLR